MVSTADFGQAARVPHSGASATLVGDRYEIDHRLARGGMADIFLADDQVLERQVVIKMLLPQYAGDPTFIERFRREATSAAKLNHPNVVAVYDWGRHDETYFMAMEYIEGHSLAELLVAENKLPAHRSLEIASEAAAGLGFAHDNGMVHRDVKPGNIMITDTGLVKVADFGIVRSLDGDEVGLTQVGNVMGTAAYFSPEQARGEIVDPRSDLYALGVVLFEMVTGERPFRATSPLSVAHQHVEEAAPLASSVNPDLSPAIEGIIANLLAKNPDHRYASSDELRADLHRVANGHEPVGVVIPAVTGPPSVQLPHANLAERPAVDLTLAETQHRDGGPIPTQIMAGGPAAVGGRPDEIELPSESRAPDRRGNGGFIMAFAALLVLAVILLVVLGTTLRSDSGDSSEEPPAQLPTVSDPSDQPEQTDAPASTGPVEESDESNPVGESSSTSAASTASTSASNGSTAPTAQPSTSAVTSSQPATSADTQPTSATSSTTAATVPAGSETTTTSPDSAADTVSSSANTPQSNSAPAGPGSSIGTES